MNIQDFIAEEIKARPIEATLVRKITRALKEAGTPIVEVFDGEEFVKVATEQDVLTEAFNLDELRLYTADGSWVYLVMGQGAEGLCDYTTDLEDALHPVNEWADDHMD